MKKFTYYQTKITFQVKDLPWAQFQSVLFNQDSDDGRETTLMKLTDYIKSEGLQMFRRGVSHFQIILLNLQDSLKRECLVLWKKNKTCIKNME